MAATLTEHVPKSDPVFLDQDLETLESAVVGIKKKLGKRAELSCSVPAVRAMNEDVMLLDRERV